MSELDFGDRANQYRGVGNELALFSQPDFYRARTALHTALEIVESHDDELMTNIFAARITGDFGVMDVREGLYHRAFDDASEAEVMDFISRGVGELDVSYRSLIGILSDRGDIVSKRGWEEDVQGITGATMNAWLRATQTQQLVSGELGPNVRATKEAARAQWMLGRGSEHEPGAWVYSHQGNDAHAAVETPFLGMRAERINGGLVHVLKGLKWSIVRGLPELGRRLHSDPESRGDLLRTSGRLVVQSLTRGTA
jgi:hypothetical protein